MNKILIAFDGPNHSEGAYEFALFLNETAPITLTGVFLAPLDQLEIYSKSSGGMAGPMFLPLMDDSDIDAIEKNIQQFETFCKTNSISYRVHKDFYNFTLPELTKETRFADLLILGGEVFYQHLKSKQPNKHLKSAIHYAECPVIVVPEKFERPKKVVLAYDGSESSVYAIKQFAYMFPNLTASDAILVNANREDQGTDVPNRSEIEELVAVHFKNCQFLNLNADPRKYFSTWLGQNNKAILVSGAFGRSAFSQLISKSFITEVIADHKLPVFVAHS